jgi:hypothetical protein
MTAVSKIDSNVTGLRVAKETSYGAITGTPVWHQLEPNSYSDFGGNITTVARETINDSRSRLKGVTTDVESTGGFESDLTQTSTAELLEGLFYAAYDKKAERFNNHVTPSTAITAVTGGVTDEYTLADVDTDFVAGDLVFASGFTNSANNGLKRAVATTDATTLATAENLEDETTPPANAKLVAVGFQFDDGDATISADGSSSFPTLVTAVKDLTQLGVTPGEFVYIGGDAVDEKFVTAANNGWARVRSVTANAMTFDKTDSAVMVTETDDTDALGIRIFFGRTAQNKVGSDIVRTSYQLERKLGAPDDSDLTQIQSEYITGAILNEFTLNLPTADKITTEMTFVGKDTEHRSGSVGVKAGTRPTCDCADAFNGSSHVTRFRLSPVSTANSYTTSTFAFVMEGSVSINNNNNRNQAIGTLGAFDSSAGTFEVSAEVTAYFQNISTLQSVRNNDDVSLDIAMVQDNAGMVIDLPLLTLSGGLAQVELNEPVKLPLTVDAAQATTVDSAYTHTAKICVFDYLPDAAE